MIYTQECLKYCPDESMKDKTCILSFQEKEENFSEKEEKERVFNIILESMETSITSEDYNTSGVEQGEDDVFNFGVMRVILTSTENQNDQTKNINVTTINLGNCEQILRNTYHIPDNEILFIK